MISKVLNFEEEIERRYQGCFNEIQEYFVNTKDKFNLEWDEKCYAPISASLAVASRDSNISDIDIQTLKDSVLIAGLAAWRANDRKIVTSVLSVEDINNDPSPRTLRRINIDKIYDKIGKGAYFKGTFGSFDFMNVRDNTPWHDLDVDGAIMFIEDGKERNGSLELRVILMDKHNIDKRFDFALKLENGRTLSESIIDTLNISLLPESDKEYSKYEIIPGVSIKDEADAVYFCIHSIFFTYVLGTLDII